MLRGPYPGSLHKWEGGNTPLVFTCNRKGLLSGLVDSGQASSTAETHGMQIPSPA